MTLRICTNPNCLMWNSAPKWQAACRSCRAKLRRPTAAELETRMQQREARRREHKGTESVC